MDVTLREHFEALLREKDLRDQQRFDAQERAVSAAMAANKELVSVCPDVRRKGSPEGRHRQ
jgi:hypothetical protein